MATALANLLVRIDANIAGFDRNVNRAANRLRRFGDEIGQVGRSMTVGFSAPVIAGSAAAVKAFGDFNQAMTQSTAIMGDLSDGMNRELARAAREVAKNTTFAAREAGEAFFFLASAGLDATQSIEALPRVARFAQAGMFDLATATDLLTDAQSALGLSVDDATQNMANLSRVSDVLVKANTLANASVQQFSESLTNRAGAALRQVNKSIEEGVAVLAAFADQGTKGAEAGTQLSIVMRDLQTKALGNEETFRRFGVSVFDSAGNMRGMADILQDLEGALTGMSDEQAKSTLLMLGFTDRSVAALQTLIGLSDQIREYEAQLRLAGGTTEQVANRQLESFNSQMTLLKNQINDTAISVGETLAPTVSELAKTLQTSVLPQIEALAESFARMSPASQQAAIAITAVVVALPPLAIAANAVVSAFIGLARITGAITAAFTALTTTAKALAAALGAVGAAATATVAGVFALGAKTADEWNDALGRLRATALGAGGVAAQAAEGINALGQAADEATEPANALANAVERVNQAGVARIATDLRVVEAAQLQSALAFRAQAEDIEDATNATIGHAAALREAEQAMIRVINAAPSMGRAIQSAAPPVVNRGLFGPESLDMDSILNDIHAAQQETLGLGGAFERVGKQSGPAASRAMREISTIITNLNQDIARMIVNWEGFGSTFTGIAKRIGEAIITDILQNLVLTQSRISAVTDALAGLLGKIPGLGGIFSAGSSAASAGAGAASSGAGAVGGITNAITGGLTAALGTIFAGVGAVPGVIGNFQNARLEGTMNAVEYNTRVSSIHLGHILETGVNKWLPYLEFIHRDLLELPGKLGGGTGGTQVVINITETSDAQTTANDVVRILKAQGVVPA